MSTRVLAAIVGSVLALACLPDRAGAQYFGRNKVQYRTFDFQILKTEHFDLYYYPEEKDAAGMASRLAERWYARLSRFFQHELRGRQVLILYAAPAHFRQTNAVEGLIDEGTGGVTEAQKRRIVVPMAGSLADTNHVIGHELVHAFQFDITGAEPRDGEAVYAPGILQYPLWFVEGMAEYLSLGPVDPQTAMWMRDAALHEKLPKIEDLEKPEYFPYRWGHAFWAFVGGKFGDRAVASLLRSAANPRYDLQGLALQLGSTPSQLNDDWHHAITMSTQAALADQPSLTSEPREVISQSSGAGRFNIGPRVSPDGRRIAFFSARDRFSIDLYVADAETGHIQHKLISSATDPHFDSLQFLNSAGAWSPDGTRLALTALRAGKCVIALLDPSSGRSEHEIDLPGLDDAINPSFSPDGKSIVLSGTRGGFEDLFLLSLDTGHLEALTHDPYADQEPAFTPDGESIVFVTERFTTNLDSLEPGALRLARLTLATKEIAPMSGFLRGKQISPQVSPDGRSVTFVAEPDGIANLYRMPIDGGPIFQISSFPTGVAGITTASPTLSMSSSGRLALSVFQEGGHAIYTLDPEHVVMTVAREEPREIDAALLPGRTKATGDVEQMVTDLRRGLPAANAPASSLPYSHKLTLDFISQPYVSGIMTSHGGFVSGGMSAVFSDMLGDRALGVSGFISGDLADIGGSVAYMNRRHRWNWAAVIEQTPYRVDYLTQSYNGSAWTLVDEVNRQTVRGVAGIAAFPFSPSSRIEVQAGGHNVTVTRSTETAIYAADTLSLVSDTSEKLPTLSSLYLADVSVALVHDTSFQGMTGPLYGKRYRLEIGQTRGSLGYTTVLADWRRYFMPKRPITIAVRGLHYGRYGADADNSQLISLYAGYPELVHGYALGSITPQDCGFVVGAYQCKLGDDLVGSRMLVGNVEVRTPLLGLFRGDIQYGVLPIDLAAFMDSGVTWTSSTLPSFAGGTRGVLRSAGGAVRINAFGLLVIEVAAARPLDRSSPGWHWQVGIREAF